MDDRRKFFRAGVPRDKLMCKIIEPASISTNKEFSILNISVMGIAFENDDKIDHDNVRLAIKFPFTSYDDAAFVWGRVVYSNKMLNKDKYLIGIAFIRKKRSYK
ncbi:MAG: hypothetical protein ABH882_03135 [Candidatus Omnitrophota bacterium]|nr:hypothetical protein [Candidatus Omnitrophota bacterium]MBU1929215.1 hypothetical protein [Candidatus Omnitrophota bacterium]MBU2034536.1 hypothetical protein [Candidatus Omnitrophota bacterium]MBU2221664.1 hypothetical protein [Candidatus Omnitrophota bacterium]MBU2258283.1 hypothetical protein [Candidatus Omnitrophota bacterium]